MDTVLWNLEGADGASILSALWRPFVIGMLLYFSGYWYVWFRLLAHAAGLTRPFRPLTRDEAVDILVVIPTMLRRRDELEDLQGAAETVLANGYPGRVVVCLSLDGSGAAPELATELDAWAREHSCHGRTILVAQLPERGGKGVAVANGLARAEHATSSGEIDRLPPVFFNMDADGVLGEHALERMVAKLVRPGRWTGSRPMIVASNVLVRREHYWAGWRGLFSMRYQLALQVAREYMTSISIARHNRGLLPVTGVSGALYCTWTAIHEVQARHAGYMRSLKFRDVVGWWFGRSVPRLADYAGAPNVAVTAGPGDDTWLAWMAMMARWEGHRIDLELPRTPLHALARLIRSVIVRPIAYDPEARVYTATPTAVRGLFKQRIRWNSSRCWLAMRFGWTPWFAWELGLWIVLDLVVTLFIHGCVLVALLAWPFADRPATWFAIVTIGALMVFATRVAATALAVMQEWAHPAGERGKGQYLKLLAVPLAGPFHLVFNMIPTIVGLLQEWLGFGCNTQFAPETTLEASGVGRPALAYRLVRAARLSWRALRRGDVPAGTFWFGWHGSTWTVNGHRGWTDRKRAPARGGVIVR